MAEESKKTLFEYDNYREFLRDTFAQSKQRNQNFSYRFFARQAGFGAHSFVIRVIQGQTDLSLESIEKFIKGLKLNKEEAFYFRHLVLLNQAKTHSEKQAHAREILRSKSYRSLHALAEYQMSYLTNWYYPPIRELVCFADFQEDPVWISKKMHPAITPLEAQRALDDLIKLGLLARDAGGRLVQATPHVTSTDEVASSFVVCAHEAYLKKASEALHSVSLDQREISSMTLGVKKTTAATVKEMIKKFRKEIMDVCSQDDAVETVYQINFQLFPMIKDEDGEDGI